MTTELRRRAVESADVQVPPRVRRLALRALGEPLRRWPRQGALPEPPTPAPGDVVGPPDVVGVGVQKAGTSWWFDLIAAHPRVAEPFRKELHFFAPYFAADFADADVERYARYFPRPDGMVTGEWTPRYMADVWKVPLIARAAPGARLLVLLRDPVERYRSGLAHDLARHAPRNPLVASVHVDRGDYAAQLRHLFDHVPREQVLVLQYERCRVEARAQLGRTFEFLGLEPFEPPDLDRRVNVTIDPKPPLPDHLRRALVHRYRADLTALAELVPDLDPDLWSSLR
ncbi:MAG TPA: sulfotransferase [Acidimicrobiia bacterium]|nr:sulfotransferase [Acidimicrobiia bacterium]